MQLTELRIHQCRNINALHVKPIPGLNWWLGPNGIGKTTILESIYLLSTGRSFRTAQARCVVSEGKNAASVYAILSSEDGPHTLGMARYNEGPYQAQMDGQRIKQIAQMAKTLPLILIHPDSMLMLSGDATFRREWIDWGLFHVEPFFHRAWSGYHRILKQRNAILKENRGDFRALSAWEPDFIGYAEEVTRLREGYVENILEFLLPLIHTHLRLQQVQIGYAKGWDASKDFKTALIESLRESTVRGHTVVGPHRADLEFYLEGVKAQHRLSRGQQKLFIYLLQIAQCLFFQSRLKQSPIILIDDMGSELDVSSRERILSLLSQVQCQVFLTAIDDTQIGVDLQRLDIASAMFHVEHYHTAPLAC